MVSTRLLGMVSTVLLVVGALAVGEALHRTVVTGQAPITSPAVVVYVVVGLAAIFLGYRARRPVSERYALAGDDESERDHSAPGDRADGEEFDPAMSPLGDAAPGETDAGAGSADDRRRRDDDAP